MPVAYCSINVSIRFTFTCGLGLGEHCADRGQAAEETKKFCLRFCRSFLVLFDDGVGSSK